VVQSLFLTQAEYQDVLETNTIYTKGPIKIKESHYKRVEPELVAAQQTHLSPQQQKELTKYLTLFSGKLGKYLHRLVLLELKPDVIPVCKWPYAVAYAHHDLFLKELNCLCEFQDWSF